MELLELLEQRVEALLSEVEGLRDENCLLLEEVATLQHKVEDPDELRRQLAQEQEVRADALARVDKLLKRIEGTLARNETSTQA